MSSQKILDKAIEYSSATGILLPCLQELLMNDKLPKEFIARSFVDVVNTTDGLPEDMYRLRDNLKLKYNL